MHVGLNHFLFLAAALFSIGVIGVLTRRNALVIFMCIELMINAANLAFIAFSYYLGDITGQGFVFMSMVVAASEVAVGLAIILSLFRNKESVNVNDIRIMKW
jgi:NADH-quinone oxidoreductase subunit K